MLHGLGIRAGGDPRGTSPTTHLRNGGLPTTWGAMAFTLKHWAGSQCLNACACWPCPLLHLMPPPRRPVASPSPPPSLAPHVEDLLGLMLYEWGSSSSSSSSCRWWVWVWVWWWGVGVGLQGRAGAPPLTASLGGRARAGVGGGQHVQRVGGREGTSAVLCCAMLNNIGWVGGGGGGEGSMALAAVPGQRPAGHLSRPRAPEHLGPLCLSLHTCCHKVYTVIVQPAASPLTPCCWLFVCGTLQVPGAWRVHVF